MAKMDMYGIRFVDYSTKVIGFWSPKGGVGKSTLAVNFADFLAEMELNCVFIDLDRQQSVSKLAADEKLRFQVLDGASDLDATGKNIKKISGLRFVVLDFPPGLGFGEDGGEGKFEKRMHGLLEACDIVVSPVLPGRFDYQALAEGSGGVKIKRLFVVLNGVERRIREDQDFISELGQSLEKQGVSYSTVSRRAVFRRTLSAGGSVFTGGPLAKIFGVGDAQREIRYMTSKILEKIQ